MRACLLLLFAALWAPPVLAEVPVQLGTFLVEVVEDKVVCSWGARVEQARATISSKRAPMAAPGKP